MVLALGGKDSAIEPRLSLPQVSEFRCRECFFSNGVSEMPVLMQTNVTEVLSALGFQLAEHGLQGVCGQQRYRITERQLEFLSGQSIEAELASAAQLERLQFQQKCSETPGAKVKLTATDATVEFLRTVAYVTVGVSGFVSID